MLLAITYRSGLKPVVLEELVEHVGQVEPVRTLLGRRHDAFLFAGDVDPASLSALRSIENAFIVCVEFEGIAVSQKGADRIAEACTQPGVAEQLVAARQAMAAVRGCEAGHSTRFLLTTNLLGKHKFDQRHVRPPLLAWLEGELGWVRNAENADMNVRLQVVRDKGFFGLAIPERPLRNRPYMASTRPGSLDPTVAYCLMRLTEPKPGDVFLDPVCGAGTIAIERAISGPSGAVLCGDIAEDAISATATNAGSANAAVHVVRWDAGALPLADEAVDKVAMNLPYGKDIPIGEEPADFFARILKETTRVTRPGGCVAVLSAHGRLIQRIASRVRGLKVRQELPVTLDGFDATISLLRRT